MRLSGETNPLKAVLLGMNPRVGEALLWPGGSNHGSGRREMRLANASMARELDNFTSSLAFKNSCSGLRKDVHWPGQGGSVQLQLPALSTAAASPEQLQNCAGSGTQARPGAASWAGELLGPHRQLQAWSSCRTEVMSLQRCLREHEDMAVLHGELPASPLPSSSSVLSPSPLPSSLRSSSKSHLEN